MRKTHSGSPAAQSYRMPAEWEPHESTWLAWPHYREDWPGKFEPIPWVYAEIIRNLARHERIHLIVRNARAERQACEVLARADALSPKICFQHWPTDRVWTRDSGCIFVTHKETAHKSESSHPRTANGDAESGVGSQLASRNSSLQPLVALNFDFNAWAKYDNYTHDAKLGSRMAKAAGAQVVRPFSRDHRVVLEGGSIDPNGCGTLLTTEECLLSTTQQRNPAMDRGDYERLFSDYLGVETVLWLGDGIAGDDTHGHVDDVTRFVAPNRVVTMVEPTAQDENRSALEGNLGRLKAARTADGRRLEVIEIPMPRPVVFEGRRLPASYANFYIANGCVLVPVFNDPNDRIALDTLAKVFPHREIVPIYSGDFIWGFGAMHCMTQQQPSRE